MVVIEPHPTSHKLSAEPAKSRADLGAILGRFFILPSLLADALAGVESDAEPPPSDVAGVHREE